MRAALGVLVRSYDRLYGSLQRLRAVESGGPSTLRAGVSRYRHRPLRLADGSELGPGDRVLVLHLHNHALARARRQAAGPAAAGFAFRRALRGNLGALAERVLSDPALTDVRAVGGLTNLWRGAARMGFTATPLRSRRWARLVAAYQERLRETCGGGREWRGRRHDPRREARLVWMSTADLIRRYGPAPAAVRQRPGSLGGAR